MIINEMNKKHTDLAEFLAKHNAKNRPGVTATHTRIPDKDLNIYPGSYLIPKEDLTLFYSLYYDSIFVKKRKEYLTEKQLENGGPMAVDFDFRYNYDVDADFYKKILSKNIYDEIKSKEKTLKRGDYFETTEGTIIVFIGNNHKWFHVPKKLFNLFANLRQAQKENTSITIVGGAHGECLEDIITTAKALGLKINKNKNYIYSATECPIK
jgi:hypothetical protein